MLEALGGSCNPGKVGLGGALVLRCYSLRKNHSPHLGPVNKVSRLFKSTPQNMIPVLEESFLEDWLDMSQEMRVHGVRGGVVRKRIRPNEGLQGK